MFFCNAEKIFLSILIPTRNRAEYLRYAIQSALNLDSNEIEIIVSENYSNDNSWDICNSFSDPRLKICQPEKPLPMHENFEFLLQQSRGEWVTFIGDDDAVMPHCVDHLLYLTRKYPHAEAIASPRAYYFWDGCQKNYGQLAVSFSFSTGEKWQDSKEKLNDVLNCKLDYIYLPQMYSGGFHRRSLIDRVFRSQNGIYFKSVIPDAYTALMACVHTYRYLETEVPMTWVGTSPHRAISQDKGQAKDRKADFFGMNTEESLVIHSALGTMEGGTFSLCFFEAYISAFPITSFELLSRKKVEQIFIDAVDKFRANNNEKAAQRLSYELGFKLPPKVERYNINIHFFLLKFIDYLYKSLKIWSNPSAIQENKFLYKYRSNSYEKHPDILSCDYLLYDSYKDFNSFLSIPKK